MEKIKIGIVGYGNIGKGTELAIRQNRDMELVAVFSRRNPEKIVLQTEGVKVYSFEEAEHMQDDIDVMILCTGSAADLPVQTPHFARIFNVVDSFDMHARIPQHFAATDASAREGKKTAIIAVGWDPGMFSMNRLFGNVFLPDGADYTFWGRGVSQGHSNAIREIKGVLDARQYTVPIQSAVEAVRNGENPSLSARQKHKRECYVVAEENADRAAIEAEIKSMPNYFADYDTTVTFISMEEMCTNHAKLPHGGIVFRSGKTNGGRNRHLIENRLTIDSNPEFTANILIAYARAAMRLAQRNVYGAHTVFDIAPADLSPRSRQELIAELL